MGRINWFIVLAMATALLGSVHGIAQTITITPDMAQVNDGKTWKVQNATAEVFDVDGKQAVRLKVNGNSADRVVGLALIQDLEFVTGIIELDMKGKNVRQQSFLGVSFNVVSEKSFEAVYFRPFNFKADDPFRSRAVQYIAWPENTWEKLRKEKPGKFEGPVNPVPDPESWFHARIEVGKIQILVFVNEEKVPCLTVDRLTESGKSGSVGLFVDVAEGLYANMKVTPDK
jgi:hypothetical protein